MKRGRRGRSHPLESGATRGTGAWDTATAAEGGATCPVARGGVAAATAAGSASGGGATTAGGEEGLTFDLSAVRWSKINKIY